MYGNYHDKRSCYYVISDGDQIVGGGGLAPLSGGGKITCELLKMFFLPSVRGLGLGRRLLSLLMDEASNRGYKKCYLETLLTLCGEQTSYTRKMVSRIWINLAAKLAIAVVIVGTCGMSDPHSYS